VSERRDTAESGAAAPSASDAPATEPLRDATDDSVRVVRVPPLSPLAPVLGWLAAWGAAVTAAACLREAGVDLGLGVGIATGEQGVEDGFWPGVWMMLVQAGAFALGGYAAARLARTRAMLHATLAWAVAMLATGADAVVVAVRDAGESVLAGLDLPHWTDTGLSGTWEEALALAVIALAGLAGALLGGLLGAGANRAAAAGRPGPTSDG
jgi:hypothetical protein